MVVCLEAAAVVVYSAHYRHHHCFVVQFADIVFDRHQFAVRHRSEAEGLRFDHLAIDHCSLGVDCLGVVRLAIVGC